MTKQRRVIGPKEKAKVAIAALKGQKTTRELSTQFKKKTGARQRQNQRSLHASCKMTVQTPIANGEW